MTERGVLYSHRKLAKDIRSFCAKHNIGTSTFGIKALKNSAFYTRLMAGRSPSLETVERIYAFIEKHDRPAKKGKSSDVFG